MLTRSEIMRRVRGRDTAPEIAVRSVLHQLGYRFRIHRRDLPGNPDIVLPRWKTSIFVHGCFWHSHIGCSRARIPKTHTDYWKAKLGRNVRRDAQVRRDLAAMGWRVHVVWECELRYREDLKQSLSSIFTP